MKYSAALYQNDWTINIYDWYNTKRPKKTKMSTFKNKNSSKLLLTTV
jgi:hypothetical protein